MSDDSAPTTPLEVLLTLMRRKWQDEDWDGAAELARAAAPYMHHRLATVAQQSDSLLEAHLLTDADLARQLARLSGRKRITTEDPDLAG